MCSFSWALGACTKLPTKNIDFYKLSRGFNHVHIHTPAWALSDLVLTCRVQSCHMRWDWQWPRAQAPLKMEGREVYFTLSQAPLLSHFGAVALTATFTSVFSWITDSPRGHWPQFLLIVSSQGTRDFSLNMISIWYAPWPLCLRACFRCI